MRFLRLAPALAAGLVLAACNNSPDEELSDEALSMEDVGGQAAMADYVPAPGRYSTTTSLLALSANGFTDEQLAPLRAAFEEGAATPATYCVSADTTPEQWVSQMQDNDCSVQRFLEADGRIDMTVSCSAADGPQGPIAITGAVSEDSSDLELRFSQDVPSLGTTDFRTRMVSTRTGDC